MSLRAAIEQHIRGEGTSGTALSAAMDAASRVYGLGVRLRNLGIQQGILTQRRLPRPVVSIGNLHVGGSGKTPLVMAIVGLLRQRGYGVAVLSRGYGRKTKASVQAVSDGDRILCSVREAGDEPFMMAHRLPGVSVWVGSDRYRSGLSACRRKCPDFFVLDDGFQHRRLYRDLDIVVLPFPSLFGNGKLLPAGPLREFPDALQRAHLAFLRPDRAPIETDRAGNILTSRYPHLGVAVGTDHPTHFWQLGSRRSLALKQIHGREVFLVCGIGRPKRFRRSIEAMGAEVSGSLFFPDHYWYTPKDIGRIRGALSESNRVVTTEKDAWKLIDAGLNDDRVWVLRMDLDIDPSTEVVDLLEAVL